MITQVCLFSDATIHVAKKRYDSCCICGKHIKSWEKRGIGWTAEHILPVAIAKWVYAVYPDKYDKDEFSSILSSTTNCAITCYECNVLKASIILEPDNNILRKLNTEHKKRYKSLYEKAQPMIEDYKVFIKEVCDRQNCICLDCGCNITYDNSIIRRIDNMQDRSIENAKATCIECGVKPRGGSVNIRYVGKMFSQ